MNFIETILCNYFTHILWMQKLKMENHSGSCQKGHQHQLKKLIQLINFIKHLFLLTLFYCVKYLMLNTQQTLENKKEKFKFVRKQLKLKFSHLHQMINWQSKWLKKLIKIKEENKKIKVRNNKIRKLKSKLFSIKMEYLKTLK